MTENKKDDELNHSNGKGNHDNGENETPSAQDISLDTLERFSRAFEASARRWELIVYPSLVAFIVLATYGFFLIFSLTRDVAVLARQVSSMTVSVNKNMDIIGENMTNMYIQLETMATMAKTFREVESHMNSVRADMEDMRVNITAIDQSVKIMVDNMTVISAVLPQIRGDVWILTNSIGDMTRPMSFFSSFFPNTTYPPPVNYYPPPGTVTAQQNPQQHLYQPQYPYTQKVKQK